MAWRCSRKGTEVPAAACERRGRAQPSVCDSVRAQTGALGACAHCAGTNNTAARHGQKQRMSWVIGRYGGMGDPSPKVGPASGRTQDLAVTQGPAESTEKHSAHRSKQPLAQTAALRRRGRRKSKAKPKAHIAVVDGSGTLETSVHLA